MKKTLSIIILLLLSVAAYSQQHTIKGQVVDNDSIGIPGVSVFVKGTTIGVQTNVNGEFSISLPDSASLVFSFIGYSSMIKKVDPKYYKAGAKFIVRLNSGATTGTPKKAKGSGKQAGPPKKEAQLAAFPWPPPAGTARTVLDNSYFKTTKTLAQADTLLIKALKAAGYTDKGYYFIPGGFALVTRIEQIGADGKSLPVPDRWSLITSPVGKSWFDYIKSIFVARPGYFRIIVFAFTDQYFQQTADSPTAAAASDWIKNGLDVLPADIGRQRFTDQHRCIALIYEYKKPDSGTLPALVNDGTLTGDEHLEKAKIIDALKKKDE